MNEYTGLTAGRARHYAI